MNFELKTVHGEIVEVWAVSKADRVLLRVAEKQFDNYETAYLDREEATRLRNALNAWLEPENV